VNVHFRATVDVSGVAKNGQVDLVSITCQQNLFHTKILGEYILDVEFLLWRNKIVVNI